MRGSKKQILNICLSAKKESFLASNIESMKFDKKTKEVEITFLVSENVENKKYRIDICNVHNI